MSVNIVLYSSTGCPYCAKIKEELKHWGLAYEERNVTEHREYFNDLHTKGLYSVPVTFVDNTPIIGYRPNKMRSVLQITPEQDKQVEAGTTKDNELFVELQSEHLNELYDLVIIGAGPAGSSAAVYAARGKLKTLVLDKAPATGAPAITHKIANYPGVSEEITGLELVERIRRQAKQYGASFVRTQVQSVDFQYPDVKEIHTSRGTIKAKTIFIAVGARGRTSKLQGEEELAGRGVSYCSTCDAAFFQNKTVAVVGDNEEAVSEVATLSRFADKVLFLVPGKKFTGSANSSELEGHPNIEVLWGHRVKEILGDSKIEGLAVQTPDEMKNISVDGVFLYVTGNQPATDFLGAEVEMDADGYVVVDSLLNTSVEGVFAGGDARRTPLKQAVIAAADGALVALGADKFVNQRSRLIPQYS